MYTIVVNVIVIIIIVITILYYTFTKALRWPCGKPSINNSNTHLQAKKALKIGTLAEILKCLGQVENKVHLRRHAFLYIKGASEHDWTCHNLSFIIGYYLLLLLLLCLLCVLQEQILFFKWHIG